MGRSRDIARARRAPVDGLLGAVEEVRRAVAANGWRVPEDAVIGCFAFQKSVTFGICSTTPTAWSPARSCAP